MPCIRPVIAQMYALRPMVLTRRHRIVDLDDERPHEERFTMNSPRNFTTFLLVCAAALAIGMLGPATAAAAPPDPCHACGTAHQFQ